MIRIVLADDHQILLDGLRRLIDAKGDMQVVATANDAASAIEAVRTHKPDVLVLAVSDDGVGFDVEEARARPTASVGLFGMAERVALVGGTIDVLSRKGAGTRVEVRVPVREEVAT